MSTEPREASSGARPETPRFEPEIIPPTRNRARPEWTDIPGETIRVRRAAFRAPGPLGIVLVLIGVGLIASVILVLLVGFVLVWIPIVAFALAALILIGALRGFWRRLAGR